jgi:hypothetical protein
LGDPKWNKLFDFMDENDFSMQDFLACVCANFLRYPQMYYETQLCVAKYFFNVRITKGIKIK